MISKSCKVFNRINNFKYLFHHNVITKHNYNCKYHQYLYTQTSTTVTNDNNVIDNNNNNNNNNIYKSNKRLENETVEPLITSVEDGYFDIGGVHMNGSLFLTTTSCLYWRPKYVEDITCQSLSVLNVLNDIEILFIGTGNKVQRIPQDVKDMLKKNNILYEVMATKPAAFTFNSLAMEGRQVAAALLSI